MKICGLEKLSMVDFEGHLACTIFCSGCNFKCPFCHNSTLVSGIEKEIPQQDLFDYLKKRKGMINSVVVSGGEPTIYADLIPFIQKIKDMGYLIKLDTNGTNPDVVETLIDKKLIDYVAMDIKNCPDLYYKTSGCKNINLEKINRTIEILKQNKIDYEFRTTLVGGHHDRDSITKMGEWLKGAKRLYLQHFVDSGTCIENGMQEISKQNALEFLNILKKYIENVYLRGY